MKLARRLALDAGATEPSCSLMSKGMMRDGPESCSVAGNWTIGIWEMDPEAIGLAALEYSKYPLSWVRLGSIAIAFAMGRRWGKGKGNLRLRIGWNSSADYTEKSWMCRFPSLF